MIRPKRCAIELLTGKRVDLSQLEVYVRRPTQVRATRVKDHIVLYDGKEYARVVRAGEWLVFANTGCLYPVPDGVFQQLYQGERSMDSDLCPQCHGEGWVWTNTTPPHLEPCRECGGSGVIDDGTINPDKD